MTSTNAISVNDRRILSFKAVVVALCGIAVIGSAFGQGNSLIGYRANEVGRRTTSAFLAEDLYSSIRELFDRADAIVEGTVIDIRPGRTEGEADHPLQYREVYLRVEQVFKGSMQPGESVTVEELGWDTGRELELNNYAKTTNGETAFFILVKKAGFDAFGLVNYAQSRYIESGDKLVGPDQTNALVQAIQRLSPDQLREKLRP